MSEEEIEESDNSVLSEPMQLKDKEQDQNMKLLRQLENKEGESDSDIDAALTQI